MTVKLNAIDIVAKMKEGMKQLAKDKKLAPDVPIVPASTTRIRDMRQEAVDLGSHGAGEYFKDGQS